MSNAIKPGPVEFLDYDAVKLFGFMPDNLYIRATGGQESYSNEDYERYLVALTYQRGEGEIPLMQITTPIKYYTRDGNFYWLDGNSRIKTIIRAKNDTRLSFELGPIPAQNCGELSDDQIRRAQTDANDTTRKHTAYALMMSIHNFVTESVTNGGMKEAAARKFAADVFGVTQAHISDSLKIATAEVPQKLRALLETGVVAPETAKLIIQAAEAVHVPIQEILDDLSPSLDDDSKISAPKVKSWRKAYESSLQESAGSSEESEETDPDSSTPGPTEPKTKEDPTDSEIEAALAGFKDFQEVLKIVDGLEYPATANTHIGEAVPRLFSILFLISQAVTSDESLAFFAVASEAVESLLSSEDVAQLLESNPDILMKVTKQVTGFKNAVSPILLGMTGEDSATVI